MTSTLSDSRRRFIRHTADVPLEVRTVRERAGGRRRGVNVSFGGLAFESEVPVAHGTTVEVRIDQV
ncbi:MAG TPA: PilZ domain-containing protein, partial [Longimicrobiaceae bacterium]